VPLILRRLDLPDPLVSLSSVTVVLGGKKVLQNINLHVKRGENWAVVGPNGSGKTTLLKVINGYQRIAKGSVSVFGERFGDTDLKEVRKRIGMVSSYLSDLVLLEDNVLDIVVSGGYAQTRLWGVPKSEYVEKGRRLLKSLGCLRYEDSKLRELSQGERQKVIIARALMADPLLLTLDEPCAGLDLKSRESFISGLEELASAKSAPSIIYVTHRIDEIPSCFNRALLLKNGRRVTMEENIEKVLTSRNVSKCFDVDVKVRRSGGRYYPMVNH